MDLILQTDKLLYNSVTEVLSSKELNQYFDFKNKWGWISNFIVPLYIAAKVSIVSIILNIGSYCLTLKNLSYKSLWNITVKAEFIFLIVGICKIFWFYFFQTDYTLKDIQYFYPLSALNITGYENLETWFIYPFQVLNLFEISYVIYLGFQIGKLTSTNTDYGLKIVGLSYVPTLLLWVATVMFFTLNYS